MSRNTAQMGLWSTVTDLSLPVKVVLPIFVTVVGTAVTVTWYFSGQVNAMRDEMKDLRRDFVDMQDESEKRYADRYTLTMKAEDALRTAIANPGLRVPDPRNPGAYLVVEHGATP